jgi:ubiquinone/menaquinone biosynthesis C-methylase UbiE
MFEYYESGLEAGRLSSAEGQLEFVRTQRIIERFLPATPSIILDIGGGPGAYACWLAREGHTVHLIDPVALHLEQASQASALQPESPITSIGLGDARKLDFSDEFADVALLLGPLYHLTERSDRITALSEARRVLKPGGILIGASISRFASAFAGLIDGYLEDPEFVPIIRQDLRNGQHRNPTDKPSYFTDAFFHHPQELRSEVAEAGFSIVKLLAIEGAAVFLQDLEEQWQDNKRRERILQLVERLESEPSILGVTGHMAVVARKDTAR